MAYAQTYHPGGGFQDDYWSSFSRYSFNHRRYDRRNRNRSFNRNNNHIKDCYNYRDVNGINMEQANCSNYLIRDGAPSLKRRKFSASTWGQSGGTQSYLMPNSSDEAVPSYGNNVVVESRSSADVSTSSGSKRNRPKFDSDEEVVFMSRDEIERCSPSWKDGIDALRETHLRYSYCAFIQDSGMRLELPQTTIGTAMVLCHRFFLRQSHACHDRFLIATAALFLAAKSEDTPRPLNSVLRISYETLHKQDFTFLSYQLPIDWFEKYRDRVLEAEHMILTTLNFELDVQHPYDPLTSVLNKLGLSQSVLVNLALKLITEGLRSSLWLQFKPHHIAAGAAYVAAKMLNMDFALCHRMWQEFRTTPTIIQDVEQQLMELLQ